MERGEESRDAAVAEDLASIALMAFGIFFVETLFAAFECAAQCGGCNKKCEQKNCPLPSANSKDDRACESRRIRSAFIQAVRSICEKSNEECEEETEDELHMF